ncbi:DICT sensory domain-containing protein [Halosegnis longus]|uniref:DICT sensory domain-containing protein n=1 Tax=Halosegnis longus TaxID=2216012 RepID=UPI00129E57DD|nr:DICT sensory domain-containing protein [Halosegnis longus]
MATPVEQFRDLLDVEPPERTVLVRDSDEPAPLMRLLEGAFAGQPVDIETDTTVDGEPQVLVVEAGDIVARSSLDALMDAFLLVNSDSYRTGMAGIDTQQAPDVLTALADTKFRMRGFPASNKEKLLLIVLSRYIEQTALDDDAGTLRTSFQRLSRLNDERGTRAVYERLADSNVDTHVYGMPTDGTLPNLTVHDGRTPAYRDSWFVIHTGTDSPAALLCLQTNENEWDGLWTFDRERVDAIESVAATL